MNSLYCYGYAYKCMCPVHKWCESTLKVGKFQQMLTKKRLLHRPKHIFWFGALLPTVHTYACADI
jgi:hypothetical protein